MLETAAEKPKQKLVMEWRKCPCGQSFKVLDTSPQIYHTRYCEEKDEGKTKKPIKDKKRPWESLELDREKHGEGVTHVEPLRPEVFQKQKEDAHAKIKSQLPTTESYEITVTPATAHEAPVLESAWSAAVGEAKGLVYVINKARFDIASLALKVCIIRKGGDQKTDKYKTGRSLKDFAKQIGVCHKTLCEWVRIKRNVIDKLPEGLYMPDKYAAAQRTACHITKQASPREVEKHYRREVNNDSPQFYFDQLVKRARLQSYYLENPENKLSKLSKQSVQEMLDYTKASLKVLKSHLES